MGLLLNFTGNGKGKTTAALGMAVRSLGWGRRTAVLQFIKGGMETGELRFFRELNSPLLIFEQLGCGLTTGPGDHAAMARAGWRRAAELLSDSSLELLVLDELNVALHHGYLDLAEVLAALRRRPQQLDVAMTGRYAPPELLNCCDLVTEMREEKHPFRIGIPASKGVEF